MKRPVTKLLVGSFFVAGLFMFLMSFSFPIITPDSIEITKVITPWLHIWARISVVVILLALAYIWRYER